MATAETAEEISKKPEVRQALSQTTGPKLGEEKVKAATKDKFWFVTHALLILGCAILYYLVGSKLIPVPQNIVDLTRRFLRGAVLIVIVLAIAKAISIYAIGRLDDAATRFTLRRIEHLLVVLVIALIVIGVIFVNWYTAVISVGIGSVIVGLAVQTPMTSFLGWIYILVRHPYRVGDRIQIEDATGDVIDVSYLDTTLWEFGGKYLSTDHPSGRIIKFPNSKVLNTMVFNYSWPLFPYIWNEIKFNIAYNSDLEFVARTMQKITAEEIGESMLEKVKIFRDLLARTPVDHLEVRERPAVLFRVNDNTWLEAIVRYLVHPKESGRVKNQLTRKLLEALNSQPDKVLFPKGNAR